MFVVWRALLVLCFVFSVGLVSANSAGGAATVSEVRHLSEQQAALRVNGVKAQCRSYGSVLKVWFGGGVSDLYNDSDLGLPGRSRVNQIRQVQQFNPFSGIQDPKIAAFLSREFRRIHENQEQGRALDLDAFYRQCLQYFARQNVSNNTGQRTRPSLAPAESDASSSASVSPASSDPYTSRR